MNRRANFKMIVAADALSGIGDLLSDDENYHLTHEHVASLGNAVTIIGAWLGRESEDLVKGAETAPREI